MIPYIVYSISHYFKKKKKSHVNVCDIENASKIHSVTCFSVFLRFCVLFWHEVKSVSVKEGGSVLLQTAAKIQTDDLILWTFGPKHRLVVKSDSGKISIGKRFRDRLDLNQITGSLTIKNIGTTDSGHFELQIINSEQTTFRRFNVTVTGE